jgi:membrane protein YqaA with SNARE-associated domain
LKQKFLRFHLRLKSKDGYTLAWKALVRLIIIAGLLVGVFFILQSTINDFTENLKEFLTQWPPRFVLILFFVSETILGLIPPDIFIAWSHQFTNHLWMLTILAFLSYFGGMTSYLIGRLLGNHPKIKDLFYKKFASHMHRVYQLGGFIIVFSAIFPLPFAMACMAAGAVKYSFKKTLLLGLTRLLRFYGYAILVYALI